MQTKIRCNWCLSSVLYQEYHDQEWGKPVYDDATLFEFLILETFQAGLSWITILQKRENFRQAFDQFDYTKIAKYSPDKIQDLLQDAGIVRNKRKVHAAVTNAQAFIKIQSEFGSFCKYIWAFTNNTPIYNYPKTLQDVAATTALSDTISKDLKKRGFQFVGSTVTYAYLQAVGIVNDHLQSCWKATQAAKETF
ncbi:DNA-3-methyladenine glycosylase I [Flavobacterium crassostreae]|uniref:DNA-3-methyladenine glycosylase n=1 Tax=Flavobacterium crassostreae TaxID=1763534 RepID=A0A1B9E4P6_9FLAO|nr:DNA-3-methyladenine glycosylase I [Flavobacterium crassostreae]OCB76899.1 DNA-3-methyladenine glycosylase [Flavobacterium crassostreae]